jgi:hypothetical protein
LIPILDRGRQLGLVASSLASGASIAALPIVTVAVLFATNHLRVYSDPVPLAERADSALTLLLATLLVAEAFCGLWVARKLFPTLEILPPGRNPVLERFRGWVITGTVAVGLSLLASFLYGLANP